MDPTQPPKLYTLIVSRNPVPAIVTLVVTPFPLSRAGHRYSHVDSLLATAPSQSNASEDLGRIAGRTLDSYAGQWLITFYPFSLLLVSFL